MTAALWILGSSYCLEPPVPGKQPPEFWLQVCKGRPRQQQQQQHQKFSPTNT